MGLGRLAVLLLSCSVSALLGLGVVSEAGAEDGLGPSAELVPAAGPADVPPEAASPASSDPLALIGLTLGEAHGLLGAPAEVFAYRGAEAWQDDVVYYFPSHLYLFWFKNRVWQVRADARYAGSFLGLRMGASRDEVIATVGRQFQDVDGSLVFFLADASLLDGRDGRSRGAYPLRLRAFFQDGRLADVYLYRADF
jgi:hypothetical protein